MTFSDRGTLGQRADEVKRRLLDPAMLAAALNLPARQVGTSLAVLCPQHGEKTPSCSLRVHDNGIGVYCFGCGLKGTALDLIAAVHGLALRGRDFVKVVELAEAIAGTQRQCPLPQRSALPSVSRDPAVLKELWDACPAVTTDPAVTEWIASRGLDPGDVLDRQLARALPHSGALPPCARTRAGSWRETGHLCVLPTWNAAGQLVGLRARFVGTGHAPRAKELAPCGGCDGVFADALTRHLLAGGSGGAPVRLVIAEGSVDFLTWATVFSDADEAAPGVVGIYSGAWTASIAERITLGNEILIRMHADAAGERYRAAIEASLGDRCRVLQGEGEEPQQ